MSCVVRIAFFLLGALAAGGALSQQPNILFLLADDQRPDTIAAHGNPSIRTPHLDELVARGFSFRRNYCMGSTGGAVCVPSRAMIMTGRSLYRVPTSMAGVQTLGEVLGAHGYTTFGTGKWHNGQESFLRTFEQGRAVFLGGMCDHTQVPVVDLLEDGTLGRERVGERFSSALFADAAVEFIEGYGGPDPFFAYVAFTAPHDPRQPPLAYRQPYYEADLPLPENYMPQHPFFNGWMTGRDETLAGWPRTREVVQQQLAEYYGLITHLDEQVGRILDALEVSGQADNTVIVYAADHGLAVGSHGLLGKQNLYEQSMGAPLIVAGPGIPAGESSTALTYLHDLFPTLCDVAGAATPEGVDGKSLRPVWEGRAVSVRESLFLTYEDIQRAVRDERWKLIRYPKINYTQLFDLGSDPHELNNLAGDPEQAPRIVRMQTLLREWQARTDDTAPLRSEEPLQMGIDLTGRERTPDRWQPDWIVEKYFPEWTPED